MYVCMYVCVCVQRCACTRAFVRVFCLFVVLYADTLELKLCPATGSVATVHIQNQPILSKNKTRNPEFQAAGKMGPKMQLPDNVIVHEPKEETPPMMRLVTAISLQLPLL